mmetsp:Transcript_25196/g.81513  ORF Transcript_25196/g.81513 Transcript_25196/m.81513 type:complete len:218 (+) Transcript_25196:200-853(+)
MGREHGCMGPDGPCHHARLLHPDADRRRPPHPDAPCTPGRLHHAHRLGSHSPLPVRAAAQPRVPARIGDHHRRNPDPAHLGARHQGQRTTAGGRRRLDGHSRTGCECGGAGEEPVAVGRSGDAVGSVRVLLDQDGARARLAHHWGAAQPRVHDRRPPRGCRAGFPGRDHGPHHCGHQVAMVRAASGGHHDAGRAVQAPVVHHDVVEQVVQARLCGWV